MDPSLLSCLNVLKTFWCVGKNTLITVNVVMLYYILYSIYYAIFL